MLKRYIRPLSTLLTLALITILLVGCTSKTTATHHSHQINVVASLDFYGETAKAVLGDKTVTSIIDKPSMEPWIEPTTKTAKQVSDADVIVYNGLGYDTGWTGYLLIRLTINVAQGIRTSTMVITNISGTIWKLCQSSQWTCCQFAKRQPQISLQACSEIYSLTRPLDRKITQLVVTATTRGSTFLNPFSTIP